DNKFQITQMNAIRSIPAYAPILFPTSLHLMTTGKSERALLLFLLNRPLTMENLHYRKISSSLLCHSCNTVESTEHYFLWCNRFAQQRLLLRECFDAQRIEFTVSKIFS